MSLRSKRSSDHGKSQEGWRKKDGEESGRNEIR
jgi:hypothetical protein